MDQSSKHLDVSSLTQSPRRKSEDKGGSDAGDVLESALVSSSPRLSSSPGPGNRRDGVSFKDIPVGQKLALIALSLLLPVGLLLYFATSRVQQDIAFAAKERVGVEYLKPLKDLQNSFQEYRLQLTNFSAGDASAEPKIGSAATMIDAAIAELTMVDQRNNGVLEVTADIGTIQGKWDALKAQVDVLNLNMLEITPAIQSVIEGSLGPLFVKVADNSNLTLDPEVDSYYLQNMLVNQMPAGISRIGAFRTVSRSSIDDGVIDAKERASLASNYVRAEDAVNGIFGALDRAKAASPFVAEQVAETEAAAREAAFGLVETFGENIVTVEQPTITFEEASALTNPRAPLYALFDTALLTLDQVLEQRIQGLQRTNLLTLAGVAVSLLLAFLVIYFITRQITRPLNELSTVSDSLAKGDLSRLANIESRDEIGKLAKSFNNAVLQLRDANARQEAEIARGQQLQQNIGQFLEVAMDIAQGDLTKRGQVSEDALGNVVDAINYMTEELGYVLKGVQSATQSVNQGASDMFGTADSIARSAAVQAQEAQKARDEVQVITSSIRQMAITAGSSAQAAERTLQASQEGREAVTATLSEMQSIRREVQTVAKRVKGLSERSAEISEIVETISKIAKQTNLLALNAALEASAAGDAGARFATVAGEVRQLAENTTASVQRVAALIKSVQDEVQEVLAGVETGNRQVEDGYRVAQQAGQRLEEIATIAEQTAQFAQEISAVTREQVNRTLHIGQVVEQMAEISQTSQATVSQGREAAERLQTLANQLSSSIARFRVA
jgi:twitching motility protein PilJ